MTVRDRSAAIGLTIALAALLGGCASFAGRAGGQTPAPMTIVPAEYTRVFKAAVNVLEDQGFVIDRQDHRFGRITTKPRRRGTLAEPWRYDGFDLGQTSAATMYHQRQTVTVLLDPSADAIAGDQDPESYELRVEVLVEQKQQVLHRLDHSVDQNVFSSLTSVPAEWERRRIPAQYWVAIGRNPALEHRLMRQFIMESLRIEGPDPANSPDTSNTPTPRIDE